MFQGAICQGESKASVLAQHLATNLNSRAAVRAISAVIDTYYGRKNQDVLLGLIGIIRPKDSDMAHTTKYVSRMFNRLMMLPMEAQVDFFEKVSSKLEKLTENPGIFSDLNAIDIPAEGFDTDVSMIATDEWKLSSGNVQMRHLKIDRILTYAMLKPKMTKGEPGFFKTDNSICYVVQHKAGNVHYVYEPFCRELVSYKKINFCALF